MASVQHHAYSLDHLTAAKFDTAALKRTDLSDYMLYKNGNLFTPYAYVYKDLSPICAYEGYGVFAARDIPKHTPVTFYPGRVYTQAQQDLKTHTNGDYVYEFSDGEHMVDGLWIEDNGPWWTRHGIGHLLNDNIHHHATGQQTNAFFAEVTMWDHMTQQTVPRVVIVTMTDVAQGQELFVSYGLSYWLYRWHHDPEMNVTLSTSTLLWLDDMNTLVQELIQRMRTNGGCGETLEDQMRKMSITDTDKKKKKIMCSDLYDNTDYCPTCAFYDMSMDTEVREGAFDLLFAFHDPCDIPCCNWVSSRECRLTVAYVYDLENHAWRDIEVSCWKCGKTLASLCWRNEW